MANLSNKLWYTFLFFSCAVKKMKNAWIYVLVVCIFFIGNGKASGGEDLTHGNKNKTANHGIHIFKFDFGRHIATPFVVCCWVLLASIAKIGLISMICFNWLSNKILYFKHIYFWGQICTYLKCDVNNVMYYIFHYF